MVKHKIKDQEKKKAIMPLRLEESLKRDVVKKAKLRGTSLSEDVRNLIRVHYRTPLEKRSTEFRCDNCNARIKPLEQYFCGLANLEKFVESEERPGELETEIIDSIALRILCYSCAEKIGCLKIFTEPTEKTIKVRKSFRPERKR